MSSCRVCGRPLRSRSSAKKGIGPECEKRLMAAEKKMKERKAAELAKLDNQTDFIDELKGVETVIDKCNKCGKEIRFIKRRGDKAIVVNNNPIFFIPNDQGELYVMTNGSIRRGSIAQDGIKGFTLHNC